MSDATAIHLYAIALGSNRRHGRHGAPKSVIDAALAALAAADARIVATSASVSSAPLGPSRRCYANAAALIETGLAPPALLALLKHIERAFGRRPGQRWGARVLDLDIILWSGGDWASPTLSIPHPHWHNRRFVTDPLARIAPNWPDPHSNRTVRHIAHRLRRGQPVDRVPRTA